MIQVPTVGIQEKYLKPAESGKYWYLQKKYSPYLGSTEMSDSCNFGKPFFWQNIVQTSLFRPKKVALFPEIGRVKTFLSLTRPHSRMCLRIYIFNFKNKEKTTKKVKESKEEKRISAVNLTGYGDIGCKFALCTVFDDMTSYLIKSWITPACSYEFNVVYVQGEKSEHLLDYNNITFKNRKSLRDIFVYHFLFYICLFEAVSLL